MLFSTAVTGLYDIGLPQWGRCFWQAPSDGTLFLAFASGTGAVYNVYSSNSGVSWSQPEYMFPVDDFSTYNNFDVFMDPRDHIHCAFQYNNSGCYRFFGRVPIAGSGWNAASGAGIVPITATQVGSGIPGLHASITVSERQHSTLESSITAAWPLLRVVLKNSAEQVYVYHMGYPYTGTTFTQDAASTNICGASGGFPVIWNDARGATGALASGACGISYYNAYTGRMESREKDTGAGTWSNATSHPRQMQVAGFPPPGYGGINFAIGSGAVPYMDGHYFISSSGTVDGYPVASTELFGNMLVVGTPRFSNYSSAEEDFEWDYFESIVPLSGVYGVTDNNGTNVDFTFDDDAKMHFFIQKNSARGRQGIYRVLMDAYIDSNNSNTINMHLDTYPSGELVLFEASHQNTGGKDNIIYWDKFKAAKHARPAGSKVNGVTKGVFVVTQGYTSTYPSGGILTVWNTAESPSLQTEFLQPYFRLDYTATSGDGYRSVFKELREASPSNASNWFDQDLTTGAQIVNGSYAVVELDGPRTIDRVEIVASGTSETHSHDIGLINVYASFDATNYSLIGTIPSGNLGSSPAPFITRIRTLTSETGALVDSGNEHTWRIEPFSAKYVKFQWTTAYASDPRNITEVRLFGPAATSGDIYTRNLTYERQLFPVLANPQPETFYRRQQGGLPEGEAWRTYGDFTWGIMASGDYTRRTGLPGEILAVNYNGLVPSGTWKNRPIGSGDGFAVQSKSATYYAGGATGVLDVRVNISPNLEYNSNGASGRDIIFDVRLDMHPNDFLEFYTIEEGGAATGVMRYRGSTDHDYRTITVSVPDTTHTLRWVYRRGYVSDAASIGAAWLDNIIGLDGPTINSINAYLNAEGPVGTGMIHGYLNAQYNDSIYGYLYGAPFSSQIHGYVLSAVHADATGIINGWLTGNGTWINGYLLGSSGTDTYSIPVDHIYGFVKVINSGWFESIHGYVDGRSDQLIHGFVLASQVGDAQYPTGDNRIHGYVLAFPAAESIYGIVNASGDNVVETAIHGLVDSWFGMGDQIIHGYLLGPSGELSSIHGWTMGYEGLSGLNPSNQSPIFGYLAGPVLSASGGPSGINGYVRSILDYTSIYGYLGTEALVASGGGSVGGGPGGGGSSTSNVTAGTNWIHGYLKGYDGAQYIHGYLTGPPGSYAEIYGYVLAGVHDDTIYGYVAGDEAASGVIYGVLSGINFDYSSIHGYAAGVSGYIDSYIYGYVIGASPATSIINGTLIGIYPPSSGANSRSVCLSHNFRLPTVPVVVIPSSCRNHGV